MELTYITIKLVYAPLVGSRCRSLITSSPLAEHTGAVAVVAKHLWQNLMGRVVRFLSHYGIVDIVAILHRIAVRPLLLVATHMCVTRVLSRHNSGSRRCRHRRACIGLCKAHTLACHTVDVGGRDKGLAVTSQVAITHIVAHYKYNVGTLLIGLRLLWRFSGKHCRKTHHSGRCQ